MYVIRNPNPCYGCRACELICSYHHQGVFTPEGGSIKIDKNQQTGEISFQINSSCDFCAGEDRPLCIRYCPYEALTILKGEKEFR